MALVHCTKGHQNPPGSRFCYLCGESIGAGEGLHPGQVLGAGSTTTLGLRYRITRELGHGGFGRTYLAEDLNRFNEHCVLKEFAPQVEGSGALQKAEELFQREAGVLYKLQHSQIPQFREFFRSELGGEGRLFLVQDYIAGPSYRELLEERRRLGTTFTEAEVTQLLVQLLPVLQYIHSVGVIHRDISPDNLILRDGDQMPVLIDFGGVKQVAATLASQYVAPETEPPPNVTRLGKVGYAPEEQMQRGAAFPHSDLYALAVTALVLATGQEPDAMLGNTADANPWLQQVQFSRKLTLVLQRMLALNPADRYPRVADVLQALGWLTPNPPMTPAPVPNRYMPPPAPAYAPTQGTVAIASPALPAPIAVASPRGVASTSNGGSWGKLLVFMLLIAGGGAIAWGTQAQWMPLLTGDSPNEQVQQPEPEEEASSALPPAEQARKEALTARRQALGIDYQFYVQLVNASYYARYPEQQGRTLTDGSDDAQWRDRWDEIAAEWLDQLDANLSPAARQGLGSYGSGDRDRWQQAVNELYVSRRALYDLTDAQFFHLWPEQEGQNFIDRPIGQVWYGLGEDTLKDLQSGEALEELRFEPGSDRLELNSDLAPGRGRVYIANLGQGQDMQLSLDAPRQSARLSLYVPVPTQDIPYLLSGSEDRRWSGQLPQSGYYEIVVVSTASEAVGLRLELKVRGSDAPDDSRGDENSGDNSGDNRVDGNNGRKN